MGDMTPHMIEGFFIIHASKSFSERLKHMGKMRFKFAKPRLTADSKESI
jgi:hypothetical protein